MATAKRQNIKEYTAVKVKPFYKIEDFSKYSKSHDGSRVSVVNLINDLRKKKGLPEVYPEGSFSSVKGKKMIVPSKIESERINAILSSKKGDLLELKQETGLRDGIIQNVMNVMEKDGYDLRNEVRKRKGSKRKPMR